MGVSGFFRTQTYYDHRPEDGLGFYGGQLFVARILAFLMPAAFYFAALVTLLSSFVLAFEFRFLSAGLGVVLAVGALCVGILLAQVLGAVRDYYARREGYMRDLLASKPSEEDDFRPENVDWT